MSPLAEKIAPLAAAGMTASQIGKEIHYSPNAVVGICHRNGIHLQGNDHQARRHRARVERQPGVPAPVKADPPARPLPRAAAGGGCRYIAGEVVHGQPVDWCGQPTPAGESWCAEHRAIVYDRAPAKPLI
jgi:hypothetical protein